MVHPHFEFWLPFYIQSITYLELVNLKIGLKYLRIHFLEEEMLMIFCLGRKDKELTMWLRNEKVILHVNYYKPFLEIKMLREHHHVHSLI